MTHNRPGYSAGVQIVQPAAPAKTPGQVAAEAAKLAVQKALDQVHALAAPHKGNASWADNEFYDALERARYHVN